MANPNPNEPTYPYGGGTDNPGDDTSRAGGPTDVQAVETAPLQPVPAPAGISALSGLVPPVVKGISQAGTDTPLGNLQAVPPTASGFEGEVAFRDTDPAGGVTTSSGQVRESGQDETVGESETTSGVSPAAFPA